MSDGTGDIGPASAPRFELAMRLERERFLRRGHDQRSHCKCSHDRSGYANGHKLRRSDTPAGASSLQAPKPAGDDDDPFYPLSLATVMQSGAATGACAHTYDGMLALAL